MPQLSFFNGRTAAAAARPCHASLVNYLLVDLVHLRLPPRRIMDDELVSDLFATLSFPAHKTWSELALFSGP